MKYPPGTLICQYDIFAPRTLWGLYFITSSEESCICYTWFNTQGAIYRGRKTTCDILDRVINSKDSYYKVIVPKGRKHD